MAQINVRVDDALKQQSEQLFKDLGMNLSVAIKIFLLKAVNTGGIPFEITKDVDPFWWPSNQEHLKKVMADTDAGRNMSRHDLIED